MIVDRKPGVRRVIGAGFTSFRFHYWDGPAMIVSPPYPTEAEASADLAQALRDLKAPAWRARA